MSGVDRDKLRVKQTAEVFTPTPLVQEMLDKLEESDSTLFSDPTKTFLDNSCGDGQFLSEVVFGDGLDCETVKEIILLGGVPRKLINTIISSYNHTEVVLF
jgi:hypothetical protein